MKKISLILVIMALYTIPISASSTRNDHKIEQSQAKRNSLWEQVEPTIVFINKASAVCSLAIAINIYHSREFVHEGMWRPEDVYFFNWAIGTSILSSTYLLVRSKLNSYLNEAL